MWIFAIRTGRIFHNDALIGRGYSGADDDNVDDPDDSKNNPDRVREKNVGAIPPGNYIIGELFDHPTKGRDCMRLTPDEDNEMFGRDGFMIHGDSIAHPGTSSQGCIILNRPTRQFIGNSTDKQLFVVADEAKVTITVDA